MWVGKGNRFCDICNQTYPVPSKHWGMNEKGKWVCHTELTLDDKARMTRRKVKPGFDPGAIKCYKCSAIGQLSVTTSNMHIKLSCAKCDTYMKFISKGEAEIIRDMNSQISSSILKMVSKEVEPHGQS